MPNNTEITIVAGHIKAVPEERPGKTGKVYTVLRKQEMYGSGDIKANQTMLEELKATAEAAAAAAGGNNGGNNTPSNPT